MKIAKIKGYLVHPVSVDTKWVIQKHWLLIRIETDNGIVGWGEAFTMKDREQSILRLVYELSRYLHEMDPFFIRRFIQNAYYVFAEQRGSAEFFCAVSGIEQALWDIVGKNFGIPVYQLLGGANRDKVRVYANGWTKGAASIDEVANRAQRLVEKGFDAIKFYPFRGYKCVADVVEKVRIVRSAVGPSVDILVDVWRISDPVFAVQVARKLEEFNIFWYEEPVPSNNIDAMAEVKKKIPLHVVTGECLYTKHDFREVLEKRAADILNPNVGSCGGILSLLEIASMADMHYVKIAPHNFNSTTVALAATIQVAAMIPNFLIAEYFVSFTEMGNKISINPFSVEEGHIKLPVTPGLGIEINESVLSEYTFKEFPIRKW